MHGRTPIDPRVLGLCLICGQAFAPQAMGAPALADPPPAATPAQPANAPTVVVPRIIIAPAEAPALEPVRPNVPPAPSQDLALPANPPLMREGAFIASARAQLIRGKSGRWYAIFDPDPTGRQLPPMIVLENSNLSAMERVAAREPSGTRVRLSGRTTVYRDRNFLIPSAPPILDRPVTVDPDAATNAASSAASAAANSNAPPPTLGPKSAKAEPSIEQIIADLDKAVGPRNAAGAVSGAATTTGPTTYANPGAVAAPETPDTSVTAGFLAARRGRVVRGADGSLLAVMDSGSSGRTDGPMVLLPCTNLTSIEAYVDAGGESASFTFSGDVYVYKGRRYLLPTMFTMNRTSDIVMPTH